MVLFRLMETTDLTLICARLTGWKKSSTKEQWYLPALLFPEEVAPNPASLVLTLKLVKLLSPHMSLVLFELLPVT